MKLGTEERTQIEAGLAGPKRGPRVQAPLGRRSCVVAWNRELGRYRMFALEDQRGPKPLAGQFYMMAAERDWGSSPDTGRPYLPRAFSVCRVSDGRSEFMIDAVGPGTRRLAILQPGESVQLLGPLGVGFSSPEALGQPGYPPVLVAGGVGTAPLVIWRDQLAADGIDAVVLAGYRDAGYVAAAGLLGESVELATDDGSAGHQGPVTDLLDRRLDRLDDRAVVYGCGPPAMLEALRGICVARGVSAQLALESPMACGYGACFGCVVRTRDGYRRLCVDGPVVAATDLHEEWE